ncbi:MAG TPA: hypothetical protein VJS69_13950 [Candidatus Krumholzibacteria bacterium]|nr:hypothetical protein [Candidatus Krumholzibacteria bacterium]
MKNLINGLVLVVVAVVAIGAKPVPSAASNANASLNDTPALKARLEMRRLWSDHASLTHAYMVSAAVGLPDTETLARRMQQNADDIAGTLALYYSDGAGARLGTLFRTHAMLFTDAVQMAKKNEKDEMSSVQDKLELNGRETIAFLCSLNPNWDEATLRAEFEEHVNHENDELTARVSQDWPGDLTAWNDAQSQILKLADMLSFGIERQFPERFVAAN